MLENIRTIIAVILISIGVLIEIFSVFGIFKFKYVLNRMHAAAMGDTLAILSVLLGLIVISGLNFTSLKLAIIIIFFWVSGPVSSHLISNLVQKVDSKSVDEICKHVDAPKEN